MNKLIDADNLIKVIRELPTDLEVFNKMEKGELTTEEIKEYFVYIIGKQPVEPEMPTSKLQASYKQVKDGGIDDN